MKRGTSLLGGVVITSTHSYVDTVAVHSRWDLTIEERRDFEMSGCGNVISRPNAPNGTYRGTVTKIHQPSRETIELLAAQWQRFRVTRVDVSLDLLTSGRSSASELHEFIRGSVALRSRPGVFEEDVEGTTYIPKLRMRRGLQAVIYSDRHSKVFDKPCCHLELRLKGAAAVRALGLSGAEELLTFDFRSFWNARLDLRDVPSEEALRLARVAYRKRRVRRQAKQHTRKRPVNPS